MANPSSNAHSVKDKAYTWLSPTIQSIQASIAVHPATSFSSYRASSTFQPLIPGFDPSPDLLTALDDPSSSQIPLSVTDHTKFRIGLDLCVVLSNIKADAIRVPFLKFDLFPVVDPIQSSGHKAEKESLDMKRRRDKVLASHKKVLGMLGALPINVPKNKGKVAARGCEAVVMARPLIKCRSCQKDNRPCLFIDPLPPIPIASISSPSSEYAIPLGCCLRCSTQDNPSCEFDIPMHGKRYRTRNLYARIYLNDISMSDTLEAVGSWPAASHHYLHLDLTSSTLPVPVSQLGEPAGSKRKAAYLLEDVPGGPKKSKLVELEEGIFETLAPFPEGSGGADDANFTEAVLFLKQLPIIMKRPIIPPSLLNIIENIDNIRKASLSKTHTDYRAALGFWVDQITAVREKSGALQLELDDLKSQGDKVSN